MCTALHRLNSIEFAVLGNARLVLSFGDIPLNRNSVSSHEIFPDSLRLFFAITFPCLCGFPVSDQGDGTFKNPVIFADVPDLCVVRVDRNYYMVSTTMHMSPGIPVMKSTDLVNWR